MFPHKLPLFLTLIAGVIGYSNGWTDDVATPNPSGASDGDRWFETGWPLMQTFCVDCHNADHQEAELDLSTLGDPETFDRNSGSMQRILEMVRFGAMPPEDADQPSDSQRKNLVTLLDEKIYASSCDARPRPGKVAARRLNRAEYIHSIRDLFGIDAQLAHDFPSDEVGAGFDNNGDVLSLSPVLMEKYIESAEAIASQVIADPTAWPKVKATVAGEQLFVSGDAKLDTAGGWFLAKDSFVWIDVEVPSSGYYMVAIRGGRATKDDHKTTVAIYDETGTLRGTHRLRYFGGDRSAARSEKRLELTVGKHRLFFQPIEDDQQELKVGETTSEQFAKLDEQIVSDAVKRRDDQHERHTEIDPAEFGFLFRQIDLSGPTDYLRSAFPDTHNRVVVSHARFLGNRWQIVSESARQCLTPLMRRAFRSEVSREDVEPYVNLVKDSTDRGQSYYHGLRVATAAILVSPRFLFRIETPPAQWEAEQDGSVKLTGHQLAARLSYFLWASTPDDQLLDDAAKGKLNGDAIGEHVTRMLADPKADALATQFAAQWLGLRNLDQHQVDSDRFANFTPELRDAMKRETESLFIHMVRQNRPITEMLSSDFTFLNKQLAAHYGIEGVESEEFQRVSLDQLPRRGVLSHASVLTLTSNPGRTSPVKRGKWILENILGTPPPDPPAGVPDLEEAKTADAHATLRQQLELHRASPTCASCHKVMDQLGFGLEQFDPIGRFRQSEQDKSVDASGELPGGRSFNGAVELSEILATSEANAFAGAVTERLMTFALGRELSPADRCTVEEIAKKTAKNGFRWIDLIMEVVHCRQFQYYDLSSGDVR